MGVRDELTGRSVGEFVLRERIGEGGFGAVYRCEQPLLGREAVIKVLHNRLRANEVVTQRFLREAKLASRLDHPYAAHVYAFGVEKDDGLLWIAMEMVHGTTLDRWLADRGALPLADLIPFFERIAEVVQTAHDRGIVHRDLKPSNVMVIERAGRLLPKLLDLGIAKLLADEPLAHEAPARMRDAVATVDTADPVSTLSASFANVHGAPIEHALTNGAAIGSPPYMAPELWTGGAIGPPADLYALGVLAYEALVGHRPFTAKTLAGYAELHELETVPPLGERFAPALDRFFSHALAKRPEDRPGTALELAAAFRVAAGLGEGLHDLPKLDRGIQAAWIEDAPQPLAEAVAALEGTRNLHQARDAARELLHGFVRYVLALALAARSQVRDDGDDPAIRDAVRALQRRELDDDARVRLLRKLVQPFVTRPGVHPIPRLVEFASRTDEHSLGAVVALDSTSNGRADEQVLGRLARLVAALGRLLREASFVLDYPIVVVRDGAPERWTGLRRRRRPVVVVKGTIPPETQAALVDGDGAIVLLLSPLVQTLAPAPGADRELFVFDGGGRNGARLVAAPAGFEHHDAVVWDWIGEHVLGVVENLAGPVSEEIAPYLGLTAFTAADADRFVGRDREIDAFANRLRLGALQVVVGASGAGKSSFVQAGVIPSLPPGWRVLVMRPGAAPLTTLAAKLATAKLTNRDDMRLVLETAPATAAALLADAAGDGAIVIVVDQLEELFTLCLDDRERMRFTSLLAELTATSDGPVKIICTVRDDFLMRVEAMPGLGRRMSSAVFLLGNPSVDDLVRTIVEPARRAGYEPSDADLASDMAAEVAGRPGALALLSFTASRLWELRDRRFRKLTRKAYDAMGGVGGALGQHAEDTLSSMTTEDQRLVREAFRRLVTAEGTRARLTIGELEQVLANDRAATIIDKLVSARLVVTIDGDDGAGLELAHEALLTAWPRIQQWLREDADSARMRDQLQAAARQWNSGGRSHGLLWRDDVLIALQHWRQREHGLTGVEREFADASVADAARSRRNRRRLLLGAFAVLAIGLVVTLTLRQRASDARGVAEVERERANTQLAESYAEQGRQLLLDGDTNLALVYLVEAIRIGVDSPAIRFMIARALEPLDAEIATLDHGARVTAARFAPDGRLLTASNDGIVRVWNAERGIELARLEHAKGEVDAAWNPRGRDLATLDTRGRVTLWDPVAMTRTEIEAPGPTPLPGIRFSPDARHLAVVDPVNLGGAVLDLASRGWTRFQPRVSSLAISNASDRAAGGSVTGEAFTWKLDGTRVAALAGHRENIWQARFNHDDSIVATASLDGTSRVFEAATGAVRWVLHHERRVTALAFPPTGDLLATVSADRTARLWNVRTGLPVHTLRGHAGQLNHVAFTPDGNSVLTSANDGTTRWWDARMGIELAAFVHAGSVYSFDVSADGKLLATASWAGSTRVFSLARSRRVATWSARDASTVPELIGFAGATLLRPSGRAWVAIDVATGRARELRTEAEPIEGSGGLSADGSIAAVTGRDGVIRVVQATDGALVREIAAHAGKGVCASVSADGKRIASYGGDGELVLADRDTGAIVARRRIGVAADRLVFSPDGQRMLLYGERTPNPQLLDAGTLASIAVLGTTTSDGLGAVAFSPDSRHVAVTSDRLAVWTTSGELVATLNDPEAVSAIAWHPDSTQLAAGLQDGTVVLWSIRDSQRRRFNAHGIWLNSIAFSPDGALLATAAGDFAIAVWDARTALKLSVVPSNEVAAVQFDRTGDRLLVVGPHHLNVWRADRTTTDLRALTDTVRCRARLEMRDGRAIESDRAGCSR